MPSPPTSKVYEESEDALEALVNVLDMLADTAALLVAGPEVTAVLRACLDKATGEDAAGDMAQALTAMLTLAPASPEA